jgi:hypothetical protein
VDSTGKKMRLEIVAFREEVYCSGRLRTPDCTQILIVKRKYKDIEQALRTCSKSPYKNGDDRQDDHLEEIVKVAFPVLPESASLIQSSQTAFHYPPFGQYRKSMLFSALYHFRPAYIPYRLCEWLS